MHFSHTGFYFIQTHFCTVFFVIMNFNSAVVNNEDLVIDGLWPEGQIEGVGTPEDGEGRAEGPEENASMPVCRSLSIPLSAAPAPQLYMNSANSGGAHAFCLPPQTVEGPSPL